MARNGLNSSSTPSQEFTKSKINKKNLQKISALVAYLKPYKRKFLIGMVFLLLSSVVGLAFPAIIQVMVDCVLY